MSDIDARLSELNISRVIIGTAATENPDLIKQAVQKYPGRIVAGIDAKNGRVAVKGWAEATDVSPLDLALAMKDLGIETVIYTDIAKDGMLTGPNVDMTAQMVQKTGLEIIASGGVSCPDDIRNIKETGAAGVIRRARRCIPAMWIWPGQYG